MNRLILWIIMIILLYIVLKTFIEEIVKSGVRGLFLAIPKVLKNIVLFIPQAIFKAFKLLFSFLKAFLNALRICLSRN